jgi:hypothetical protein
MLEVAMTRGLLRAPNLLRLCGYVEKTQLASLLIELYKINYTVAKNVTSFALLRTMS